MNLADSNEWLCSIALPSDEDVVPLACCFHPASPSLFIFCTLRYIFVLILGSNGILSHFSISVSEKIAKPLSSWKFHALDTSQAVHMAPVNASHIAIVASVNASAVTVVWDIVYGTCQGYSEIAGSSGCPSEVILLSSSYLSHHRLSFAANECVFLSIRQVPSVPPPHIAVRAAPLACRPITLAATIGKQADSARFATSTQQVMEAVMATLSPTLEPSDLAKWSSQLETTKSKSNEHLHVLLDPSKVEFSDEPDHQIDTLSAFTSKFSALEGFLKKISSPLPNYAVNKVILLKSTLLHFFFLFSISYLQAVRSLHQ